MLLFGIVLIILGTIFGTFGVCGFITITQGTVPTDIGIETFASLFLTGIMLSWIGVNIVVLN